MEIEFEYGIVFGPGDASDVLTWHISLTPEEEAAYNRAVKDGTPLDQVAELDPALRRAYAEIEAEELKSYRETCGEDEPNPFDEQWGLIVRFPEK